MKPLTIAMTCSLVSGASNSIRAAPRLRLASPITFVSGRLAAPMRSSCEPFHSGKAVAVARRRAAVS